jgi:hypothetical protein
VDIPDAEFKMPAAPKAPVAAPAVDGKPTPAL